MNVVKTIADLRAAVARARGEGKRIGFVPTMGNLHAGHVSLVQIAAQRADFVVASIFVNPLQFGAGEDLDKYPRTLAADQEKLLAAGCHLLFHPDVAEIYPHGMGDQTRVSVPGVSEGLCGASRPGHFEGVATVVNKLFNMVQPDVAVFGQKDFQQLAVLVTAYAEHTVLQGVDAVAVAVELHAHRVDQKRNVAMEDFHRGVGGLPAMLLVIGVERAYLRLGVIELLQHAPGRQGAADQVGQAPLGQLLEGDDAEELFGE
mgnify:CR=1 FL=1